MFIVIESIDGGGCQTQAELLHKKLGDKASYIKFPHYDTAIGKMIQEFMYDNKNLLANEQFLLYSLQFVFDAAMIKEKSKQGILISDRYFTTTLCYQTLEGVKEEVALRFAQDFGIIKPDIVFFLDVSVDTAIKWKLGEDKVLNFREKDKEFITRTHERYNDLVKRNVWANWKHINGERPIEEVNNELLAIVLEMYEQKSG